MKRAFPLLLLVAIFLPAAVSVSALDEQPSATLFLQPLGFLQFGPVLELELPLAESLFMSFHVRFTGLGLLSHLLITDGTEFWGLAGGLGMRYLFGVADSPHAWFAGGMVDIGVNGFYGDLGSATAYHGVSVFMVVAANGGYRWRFGPFILEAGVYAGIGPTLASGYYYDSNPWIMYVGNAPFTFFGMGELSLGLAF